MPVRRLEECVRHWRASVDEVIVRQRMNGDLQEAVTRARAALDLKNTLVLGEEWYGVRELFDVSNWRRRRKGLRGYDVFAEDDCGNEFLRDQSGAVYFWDHETSDVCQIAESLAAFLAALVPHPKVELLPGQVKEAWIDPAFLEEQKRLGNKEA